MLLIFRESPSAYGFALGDWKLGLMLTAAGMSAGDTDPMVHGTRRRDGDILSIPGSGIAMEHAL